MTGRIVKAVSDFYYVYSLEDFNVYACKAKGIFRKDKLTPLVGDLCSFEFTHTSDIEGNIIEILPRKSRLLRPAVANIDQALVIFAIKDPDPNLYLLDRFLVNMDIMDIPVIIIFNKIDLDNSYEKSRSYQAIYEKIGYKCLLTSLKCDRGTEILSPLLEGKVTSVAGPSGVGKSSMINFLKGEAVMETGDISKKNRRGKQTTRHTELVGIGKDTFIVDTPGFSNVDITGIEKEELGGHFPEFVPYLDECRFAGCSHISEPDCAVKNALSTGDIDGGRYEHYKDLYTELSNIKKY